VIQSSFEENRSVHFRVLSDDEVWEIRRAAFDVMAHTGFDVHHAGARDLLKGAGAIVREKRVKVPQYIIEGCVRTAPKGFSIYDRHGVRAMEVEGRKSYFGTATASPKTRDAFTGEIRETRVSDIALSAKVADALPNLDYVMPMGSSQDVPPLAADVHEFLEVVRNTTKPIVFIAYSPRGVELVYEMAAQVAGGLDALREHPFVMTYPEPISPLVFPEDVVEKMLITADLGMPQIPGPAIQPGATGPVTLAGSLAQLVAEGLMALTLIQLRNPGVPCFLGGNLPIFDMGTATMSIAAPEMSLGMAAHAEVAQSFGLPSWGLAGCTDAKVLDAQAGLESAFSILAQALSGLNLIHDVGYMDMAMVCSAELLAFSDDAIGMAKRFIKGFDVNAETLAREVIQQVGPGGHYLQERHTVDHFRDELWRPSLLTRDHYLTWEQAGSLDLSQRSRERVREILETHQVPPLPDGAISAMERIVDRRTQELAGRG
jgi:trimethylamine--corrinoid protein Co-methyltransferase